jgi:ribosomal protein L11 methylase PrmA
MEEETINSRRAAAQQLLDQQMQERLAIIEKLATTQDAEERLLAQLAEVRQQRTRDWAEAQRLGWTPKQLRQQLKLRPPQRTAGRAPRTTKHASPNGAPAPAGPDLSSPAAGTPPTVADDPAGTY